MEDREKRGSEWGKMGRDNRESRTEGVYLAARKKGSQNRSSAFGLPSPRPKYRTRRYGSLPFLKARKDSSDLPFTLGRLADLTSPTQADTCRKRRIPTHTHAFPRPLPLFLRLHRTAHIPPIRRGGSKDGRGPTRGSEQGPVRKEDCRERGRCGMDVGYAVWNVGMCGMGYRDVVCGVYSWKWEWEWEWEWEEE